MTSDHHLAETLEQRLSRLSEYIGSTRYALTESDVRYDYESGNHRYRLAVCPLCGQECWDGPKGHKLAKCWNYHPETGGTLAFDTMSDDEEDS